MGKTGVCAVLQFFGGFGEVVFENGEIQIDFLNLGFQNDQIEKINYLLLVQFLEFVIFGDDKFLQIGNLLMQNLQSSCSAISSSPEESRLILNSNCNFQNSNWLNYCSKSRSAT